MLNPPLSAYPVRPSPAVSALGAGELFVAISAMLSGIGWVLAGVGYLHATGYAVALGLVVLGVLAGRRTIVPVVRWPKFRRRRWKRLLPLSFAGVLVLSILGGAIHLPSNYDALSYRTPQLLHWVDAGRWHWIATPNSRMNIAPPGYNWLAAPLLLFTGTDRWTYLPNIAAFTLFPGFLFEMMWRAGVRKRVAWWWMWLFPLGYVFVTQAGGVGNDMIGAVFAAAALAFAFRARITSSARVAGLSLLAVALCTGIKNVSLPIVLPWLVTIWPAWRVVLRRPLTMACFATLAVLSSCLPTTILNLKYTRHWTGDPADEHRVRQPDPLSGALSNAVVLAAANSQPPLWPATNLINEGILRAVERSPLAEACRKSPRFEARWYEIPSEEHAGIGPGIILLAVVSIFAGCRPARTGKEQTIARRWGVGLAGCLALLIPVSLMSTEGLPRLIAPLCVPVLLLVILPAGNELLTRQRLWRWAAGVTALLPFPTLLISPARPLVPVIAAFNMLMESPQISALARAERVYRIYDERPDAFLPLKRFMPASTHTVWLITFGDEPETSLWRPFGSRSVRHMLTLPAAIESDDAVVISEPILQERFGVSIDQFALRYALDLRGSTELDLRASGAPGKWSVLVSPRK